MKKYLPLLGFLALVAAISYIGSAFTMPAVAGWYQNIAKAPWNPPDWVFAPVWTTLYAMIAISGWRIWQKLPGTPAQKLQHMAYAPYWTQLCLNLLWSILFFGYAQMTTAAVEIVLLLIVIAVNIKTFRKHDKLAAWLLMPYLLWVAYASTLNIAIVVLN